jgi:predicted DNA-binding transcriptional regulator YafY
VSQRTIYRDLNAMGDADIPCYHDRESGSYRIRRDYFLRPPQLSQAEALALICLGRGLGGTDQIAALAAAGSAADKLLTALPAHLRVAVERIAPHVHVSLQPACAGDVASLFNPIVAAIGSRRVLEVQCDPSVANDFAPQQLGMHLAPYVVGRHVEGRCIRCLRLATLVRAMPTSQSFEMPARFDAAALEAAGDGRDGDGGLLHTVELHVAASQAAAARPRGLKRRRSADAASRLIQ